MSGCGLVTVLRGWVVWDTLVLHIGDVAVLVVCVVRHNLGPPIGKGHPVFAADHTVCVLGLLFVKAGSGVLVLHSVGVAEGLGWDLVGVTVAVGSSGKSKAKTDKAGHTEGYALE